MANQDNIALQPGSADVDRDGQLDLFEKMYSENEKKRLEAAKKKEEAAKHVDIDAWYSKSGMKQFFASIAFGGAATYCAFVALPILGFMTGIVFPPAIPVLVSLVVGIPLAYHSYTKLPEEGKHKIESWFKKNFPKIFGEPDKSIKPYKSTPHKVYSMDENRDRNVFVENPVMHKNVSNAMKREDRSRTFNDKPSSLKTGSLIKVERRGSSALKNQGLER